jgi:hypothetical protein
MGEAGTEEPGRVATSGADLLDFDDELHESMDLPGAVEDLLDRIAGRVLRASLGGGDGSRGLERLGRAHLARGFGPGGLVPGVGHPTHELGP